MNLLGMEMNEEIVKSWLMAYGMNILGAILILVIGWLLSKTIRRITARLLQRARFEAILTNFLSNIVYSLALAFVIIAALNKLGVQTASLIAVLGAAGLAIGLALQGSLSNFAAGVMIVIFKHFKLGDFIEGGGSTGTVVDMNIFTTTLHKPSNEKVIIPNSNLTTNVLINYTANDERRVDHVIGVGYGDDLVRVRAAIGKVLAANPCVLDGPEPYTPFVEIDSFGDNSVNFHVRAWVKKEDFFLTKCRLLEELKQEFDAQGISIPYPQRDVHLFNADALPAPKTKKKAA